MGEIMGSTTKTSTNAYVAAVTVLVPTQIHRVNFTLTELNVNAVKYKVVGKDSLGHVISELKAETVINKNASATYEVDACWYSLEVQLKSSVDDAHGSVFVEVIGD